MNLALNEYKSNSSGSLSALPQMKLFKTLKTELRYFGEVFDTFVDLIHCESRLL